MLIDRYRLNNMGSYWGFSCKRDKSEVMISLPKTVNMGSYVIKAWDFMLLPIFRVMFNVLRAIIGFTRILTESRSLGMLNHICC